MGLNPLGNPDWPRQTADLLEKVTGSIRSKTTKPLVLIARGLVFGLIAAFGGMVMVVLVLVLLTRTLQILIALPLDHDTSVWISYLVVGGLFCVVGWLLMSKRHASE
jgi:ABC-type antimicrobial peptide transport system permease subunit